MFDDDDDSELGDVYPTIEGHTEDGNVVRIPIAPFVLDCSDVFASIMAREFPDLDIELYFAGSTVWRPQRRLVIPKNSDVKEADVDKLAWETSQKIFWEHGVFIGYSVVRAQKNEQANG